MRKAIFVGIDHYEGSPLHGCVADAKDMAALLRRHADNRKDYDVHVHTSDEEKITREYLRSLLAALFENARNTEILFYFAGHGAQSPWGAELVTQDFSPNSLGVSMNDVLTLANDSAAKEVVIILDSCYSGNLGNVPGLQPGGVAATFGFPKAVLRENVTLLTAARETEPSAESAGHGAFTRLLLEGLEGAAADHVGNVTALSLYAFASRAFDAFEQRPIFKAHLTEPAPLRICQPPIDAELLNRLPVYFAAADARVTMSPAHEGTRPIPDGTDPTPEQEAFDYFKLLRNAGLLETADNKDLYFVALDSEDVFLTATGRYFWRLASEDRL